MGLFNRNKGDSPAPAASEAGTTPVDSGAFDFDAISRDLDAQNGASSFDSLLAAPVTPAQQPNDSGDSAFDFPENDPLGLSTPPNVAMTGMAPIPASPDAVINAPLSPSASPSIVGAPQEPAVAVPVTAPKAKKSLPLIPLLGALGLFAVAGGGAMFLLNSNQQEAEPTVPVAPPAGIGQTPPRPGGAPGPGIAPGANAAPGTVPGPAPGPAVAPGPATGPGVPGANNLRSASPGIAPPPAPKQTLPAPSSSHVTVSVGQAPGTRPPSATGGLDPALASKLKALWQAGANAKHSGNNTEARKAWGEALRLRPGHPGFQDAINKLPR